MKKRDFLRTSAALAAGVGLPQFVLAQRPVGPEGSVPSTSTLVAAWHKTEGTGDWDATKVHIKAALTVPSRAHGLLAVAGGGFVAVATRPGSWMVRCDAQGSPVQWLHMDSEAEGRTLDGHVCTSADGQWLYTAETHPHSGQGWVSVRDPLSLRKVAQWSTFGIGPHQLLLDSTGALMVANGGLLRAEGDKKRDLHLMDSSLVRLDPQTGQRLGQWRLKDSRLGIRHMAWSQPQEGAAGPSGKALLGIALQNEHDDLTQRRGSPVLAVWDGASLQTPSASPAGGGYAGDIVAGPQGGFVLSCLRTNMAVQWSPTAPEALVAVAEMQEVGALAPWMLTPDSAGVLLGSARGIGRWHPARAPVFVKWPSGFLPDNHWVLAG
jgi:hypothetical protein